MKAFLITLAMMLALSPVTPSIAAGNNMPGIILPGDTRCKVSASSEVIDYGSYSRGQLQDAGGQKVSPGKRILMVNAVCPYKKVMRVILHGDKASNGNLRYGNKGSVTMRLLDAQLDGKSVQVAATKVGSHLRTSVESNILLQPGQGIVAIHNDQPAEGRSFTARIEIEPVMPESDARVSAYQTIESNLTFELAD